jgi:hypothetical protein
MYSNLGAKKFSGVNPRTPNKREGREEVRGWGRGGDEEGVGKLNVSAPKFVVHAPPMNVGSECVCSKRKCRGLERERINVVALLIGG